MKRLFLFFVFAALSIGVEIAGLGGTFSASASPISGNLVAPSAHAPELQKVYYYHRYARRHYRRAYRRYGGYYGGYYPGYSSGYYSGYSPRYYGGYYPRYHRRYYGGYYRRY